MATLKKEIHDACDAMVKALSTELPGLSFGYIGNCGMVGSTFCDDRSWRIFLPHPGRVGRYADSVYVDDTTDVATLPPVIRRRYHDGSLRVPTESAPR